MVQNEDSAIIDYKIVPNDTRSFVTNVLEHIWQTTDRIVDTECIYTDNARIDSDVILQTWEKLYPNKSKITILQVFIHVYNLFFFQRIYFMLVKEC